MPLFGANDIHRLQRKGKIDKLVKALRHPQGEIRESAARALGELANPAAVVPLIVALDDWNIDVRIAAAEALGEIRDQRAVDALARAFRERSLRKKSFEALVKIGAPSIKALISLLPESPAEMKKLIIDIFGKIGSTRSIPPLIDCLRERDRDIQDAAAVALLKIGRPALPALRELLADRRKAVRAAAAKIIGRIGDPREIEALVALLKDENYQVRKVVVQELDRLGWRPDDSQYGSTYWVIKKDWKSDEDAEHALLRALDDDLVEVRLAAVRQLGKIKSKTAIGALADALKDQSFQVRQAAVESLGKSDDMQVIEPLFEVMMAGHEELARQAAKSLQRFGKAVAGRFVTLLSSKDDLIKKLSAETLGNIGDTAATVPLMRLLISTDEKLVATVIEALGKIQDPATRDPLLPFLKHGDETVREKCVTALGYFGDSHFAEPLMTMLRDPSESVRLATAKALGEIANPVSVAELINSLNDSSMRVREGAAQAIGSMGAVAIKPLIATLGDWDKDIQAIRKALTTIGSSAIKPLIVALGSGEEKVSEAASKVLDNLGWQPPNDEVGAAYYIAKKQWMHTVRIGQPAIGPLVGALKDADVWVRSGAIEALGNIGQNEAVEPLISMFNDRYWNVRDTAVEALVKIGEPAVLPLIEVLKQRLPATVEYAARALGAIGDEQAIEPLNDALFDEFKRVRKAAAAALEKMGALNSGRRCENCGKPVPKNYRTGDSCPFCDELLDI